DAIARFQAFYVSGGIIRRGTSTSTNTDVYRGIMEFTGWEEDIFPGHTEDTYVDNSTTLQAEVVDATRAEAVARGQSAHQIWLPHCHQQLNSPLSRPISTRTAMRVVA